MIIPSTTALLLLFLGPAQGQTPRPPIDAVEIEGITINVGPMADNEKVVQWKVLAARNDIDSPKALTTKARKNLTDTDKLRYHFQRVEVTGVMSVDDTDESEPDMFDKQVKPSHFNETLPSRIPLVNRLKKIFAFGTDMEEAISDTRGIPTARGQAMIDKLKGQRINELFAHSWGTEIVYLGLLNGDIIPPKKLFIVGVPEANQEKWLMLAKYTGIEVHVVGFEYDKLKMAGDKVRKLPSGLPNGAKLEELWEKKCWLRNGAGCADPAKFVRMNFDYNVGVRPPDAPKDEFFKMHLSKLDHDRMLYYRYLYDRKLFNKTAAQMDAPQLKLVKAEEDRILSASMDKAQSLIAQAREQVKIAQIDHDARLRATWIDIARRSCADPGSVPQAELSALPDPYQENFQQSTAYQNGLDSCGVLVYLQLGKRMTAERLRQISTPVVAAPLQRPLPIAQPAPPGPQAAVPAFPFSSSFQGLRNLAVTACNSPGSAVVDRSLIQPRHPFSFERGLEDQAEASLSSGLGECQRRLFQKLIDTIRSGQGTDITELWVRDWAAVYSRSQDTPSFDYSPPKGCIPGDNSRRNCIACRNRRCD